MNTYFLSYIDSNIIARPWPPPQLDVATTRFAFRRLKETLECFIKIKLVTMDVNLYLL